LNPIVARRRQIAIVAVVLVLGVGYVGWQELPRDRARPAKIGEALRAFRARAVRPLRVRPGEPAPGVYRYATTGRESVDAAILSAGHVFPHASTIAVIPTRCGLTERWQVLATRWMEVSSCREAHGYRLLSIDEMHEFFGVGREVLYRCREPARPGAAGLRPGMEWRGSCETDDGSSSRDSRFSVLGFEPVRVGGRSFDAVHIRTRLQLLGTYSGSAWQEEWRRRSDGLLLRRIAATDATMNGTPDADYSERYEIGIRSPSPDR
jgi:hypothetical protein